MEVSCLIVHPCSVHLGFSPQPPSLEFQSQKGNGDKTDLRHTKLHSVYDTEYCSLREHFRPLDSGLKFKKVHTRKQLLSVHSESFPKKCPNIFVHPLIF